MAEPSRRRSMGFALKMRFAPDSPLGTGFEPSVPRGKGPAFRVSVLFRCDFRLAGTNQRRIERLVVSRGTDGSNPVPSSGESVSLPELLSGVENPGFPSGCAPLAWRSGRQRRAGCFKIAPTGGNISVAPYSSTAVPLMASARMARRAPKVGWVAELDRMVDLGARTGLHQSPARSAYRARQAAGVSARGASLASDRAAAAHRGSPGRYPARDSRGG